MQFKITILQEAFNRNIYWKQMLPPYRCIDAIQHCPITIKMHNNQVSVLVFHQVNFVHTIRRQKVTHAKVIQVDQFKLQIQRIKCQRCLVWFRLASVVAPNCRAFIHALLTTSIGLKKLSGQKIGKKPNKNNHFFTILISSFWHLLSCESMIKWFIIDWRNGSFWLWK